MGGIISVLCIEDDTVVTEYIASILDSKRFNVTSINDGKLAYDFLLSTKKPPDIILLDYILPSMDGIEILRGLKEHKKEFAIVFLTANESFETAVMAMKEGAIDYLTKSSYLKEELGIKIEKVYQMYDERLKLNYYEEQLSIFSLAVEQSPESIIITDTKGNIEYVNKKFTQHSGYSSNEVKGKNPRLLKYNASYPPGFYKNLWETISSGKTWKGEFVNRKKNGDIFYEKAVIKPIKNKRGEIISYLGIKDNITELKNTALALKKKTDELNHFFSVVVDLLCIVDSESGKITLANKAWEKILGFSTEEINDKFYTDFVHPDDLELTDKAHHELLTKGNLLNFINRYRCKDGTYKFIEWNSVSNYDGNFYSSARDITDRKNQEHIVKDSENKFRSIFEMANAGIFFANQYGNIVTVNKAFQDILEYNEDELIDLDFNQFTHPDDTEKENELLKDLIFKEIDQYRIEKRYLTKSNKIIWVDLAVTVINDDNNQPISYVGVAKDISERKKYQQKLEEIIASKDKFFSILSHDLRNQFSSLMGLSQILNEKGDNMPIEKKDKFISLLYTNSMNALELLEDLLNWSRSQINNIEVNKEKITLKNLVDKVIDSIQNQANLKNIEISSNILNNHKIFGDKHMISTVIRNLANNAIKFTSSGGSLTISGKTAGEYDIISVKDNGVGMPPEIIETLFRIDSKHSTLGTNKEMGTGLGLILCKEFIDKHGGEITIKSKLGHGSEFIISLPINLE